MRAELEVKQVVPPNEGSVRKPDQNAQKDADDRVEQHGSIVGSVEYTHCDAQCQ